METEYVVAGGGPSSHQTISPGLTLELCTNPVLQTMYSYDDDRKSHIECNASLWLCCSTRPTDFLDGRLACSNRIALLSPEEVSFRQSLISCTHQPTVPGSRCNDFVREGKSRREGARCRKDGDKITICGFRGCDNLDCLSAWYSLTSSTSSTALLLGRSGNPIAPPSFPLTMLQPQQKLLIASCGKLPVPWSTAAVDRDIPSWPIHASRMGH